MRSNIASLPNLRHLSIALHIKKHHGFAAASKAVNLSPSAITQAMKSLEKGLGTELFDRSPTGAFPNERGSLFLDRIAHAFDALKLAEHCLDASGRRVDIKSRISISQLRAFITVCESGSYSLAARRLNLSQPSVYKAARTIEVEFDQKLLRPSFSGVDPTPRAREFARLASVALSEMERAQEEVHEHEGRMAGRLAIGALPLVRTRILPAAVTALLQRYPEADVQIYDGVYSDLLNSLRHGSLDLILGALRDPLPVKDIQQEHLFDDGLNIIVRAGHPVLRHPGLSLETISQLDWIVPRRGTPTRDYFDDLLDQADTISDFNIVECSSLVAIRAMLLASDRATILSSHQAGYEIENKDLAVAPLELVGSQRPIGMTTRNNWRPTRIQREFVSIVKSETSQL